MSTAKRLVVSASIATALAMAGVTTAAAPATPVEDEAETELTDEQKAAKLADEKAAQELQAKKDKEKEDLAAAALLAANAPTPPVPVPTTGSDALVAHLKDEAATLRASLNAAEAKATTLTNELGLAKTALEAAEANTTALRGVVELACTGMSVPLKASTVGLTSLTPTQLAARFNELHTEMHATFKAGATSSPLASDAPTVTKEDSAPASPLMAAAVAATQPTTKKR